MDRHEEQIFRVMENITVIAMNTHPDLDIDEIPPFLKQLHATLTALFPKAKSEEYVLREDHEITQAEDPRETVDRIMGHRKPDKP